jgi:hypothetical protein
MEKPGSPPGFFLAAGVLESAGARHVCVANAIRLDELRTGSPKED